jgi:predicted DsbA family dithiol-disulfide isomerase
LEDAFTNPKIIRIDIVSDVVCPWCVIGWKRLEGALAKYSGQVDFEIRWQPFLLNPQTPSGGLNHREHLARKYGTTPEQSDVTRKRLTELGESLGFAFNYTDNTCTYNTIRAHQLLHWAEGFGKTHALKMRLFQAYYSEQKAMDDVDTLVQEAGVVGLNMAEARDVVENDKCETAVRAKHAHWTGRGISGVPAFIFDNRYLISGGQETQVFEAQIDQIIAES